MPAEVDRMLCLGESITMPALNSPAYVQFAVEPAGIIDFVRSPDKKVVARNLGAACLLTIDRQGNAEIRGYRVVAGQPDRTCDDVQDEARRALAAAGKLDEGRRRCDCIVAPRSRGCPPRRAP
jgi:hypothetical protein